MMSEGRDRLEVPRFSGMASLPDRSRSANGRRRRYMWLTALLFTGFGAGLTLLRYDSAPAPIGVASAVRAEVQPAASIPGEETVGVALNDARSQAMEPDQPSPLDRLRILGQSWRRGGLGSNALVTFTLRNDNDYSIKDVEILCSLSRRDGSHLTDRKRVIADTVQSKGRKTFARLHVGFVNIHANRAKCAAIAARRD
jgi:hypothetical protein